MEEEPDCGHADDGGKRPGRAAVLVDMGKVFGIIAVALALTPSALAAPSYAVLPVGPYNGVSSSSDGAADINNSNQVVGTFTVTQGTWHGFRYSGGVNTDLGTLVGFGKSTATAINDAGTITGWSEAGYGVAHAFVYSGGTMRDLGTLSGWSSSRGIGINAAGYVVGDLGNVAPSPSSVGFLWNGSTMTQLPSLGGTYTLPLDINASGTIVGYASLAGGSFHAFAYAGGVISDLGTLPGGGSSQAFGMNDAGVIVGDSSGSQQISAVRWSGGTIAGLGQLPGGSWSMAVDVNSAGDVVGTAKTSAGVQRAVLWSGGTIVDLNTQISAGSGWQLDNAAAINDNGWIVGYGLYNGVGRSFVLIPDTTPPSISCGSADGLWHASNVSIGCTATDSGSGLANPADGSFSLSTSVAAGTETANASTGTRTICDIAGNCATAGPVTGNKIDRKAPSITISVPAATTYTFNSLQFASYACNDGGSGISSCSGPVANGAPIDTLSPGPHVFTVTAADAAGNTASSSIQYTVVATSWAQFHFGADRIGAQASEYMLDVTNVAGLTVDWSAPTGGSVFSSPAVDDGVVYAASTDGQLYALSAANGKQLWATKIGGNDLFSSPAVAGGRVFVGSDDDSVYALDAASGNVLWTFATGGDVVAPPAVEAGVVYVGSWDANLYALDAATGRLLWSQNVGYPVRSAAAVANGAVYVGTDDLYAFDAPSGRLLWAAAIPTSSWSVDAPAAVSNNLVLAGADDGTLYAVDASSGNVVWSAATKSTITGAPAVDGSLAYVGSTDGYLYAFDLNSGKQAWSTYLSTVPGGWVWSSPAYANGVVYVGSAGTAVDAVDASSGQLLWTDSVPVLYSSPAVADGTVYIGADDGNIYAFRR
jgi:probable HAF family extracellular repeat protein